MNYILCYMSHIYICIVFILLSMTCWQSILRAICEVLYCAQYVSTYQRGWHQCPRPWGLRRIIATCALTLTYTPQMFRPASRSKGALAPAVRAQGASINCTLQVQWHRSPLVTGTVAAGLPGWVPMEPLLGHWHKATPVTMPACQADTAHPNGVILTDCSFIL